MEQTTNVQAPEKTVKDQIKAKWGKLSENDLNETAKNIEVLSGKVQTAYGRSKESVDPEVAEFRKTLTAKPASTN